MGKEPNWIVIIAAAAAEMAKVVRYTLGSWERTTRLAILIIITMTGLYFLH